MSLHQISLAHQKLIEKIEKLHSPHPEVIKAFINIPREFFVSQGFKASAYEDIPLPIGENQTISQPSLVAKITDLAIAQKPLPLESVLEIGTGSGFQAAIASQIAKAVYTSERIASLTEKAKSNIAQLKLKNIHFLTEAQLSQIQNQQFDAIIFSAGFTGKIPRMWVDLLKINGVLVFPYREDERADSNYELTSVVKKGFNEFDTVVHFGVSFVPYIKPHQPAE